MARLDPQIAAHLGVDRLRPPDRSRRLRPRARQGRRAPESTGRRGPATAPRVRGGTQPRSRCGRCRRGARTPATGLPRLRILGARLEFLTRRLRGHGRSANPARPRSGAPEGGEVLRPDFAVRADPVRGASAARHESAVRENAAGYSRRLRSKRRRGLGAERERAAASGASSWQLLVRVCEPGEDFDLQRGVPPN